MSNKRESQREWAQTCVIAEIVIRIQQSDVFGIEHVFVPLPAIIRIVKHIISNCASDIMQLGSHLKVKISQISENPIENLAQAALYIIAVVRPSRRKLLDFYREQVPRKSEKSMQTMSSFYHRRKSKPEQTGSRPRAPSAYRCKALNTDRQNRVLESYWSLILW